MSQSGRQDLDSAIAADRICVSCGTIDDTVRPVTMKRHQTMALCTPCRMDLLKNLITMTKEEGGDRQ